MTRRLLTPLLPPPHHVLSRHLTVAPATPLLRAQAIPRGGGGGSGGRLTVSRKRAREGAVCLSVISSSCCRVAALGAVRSVMHAYEPVCMAPRGYHFVFHGTVHWLCPLCSPISPVPEDPKGQVFHRQRQLESVMLLSNRTNKGPHMPWMPKFLLSPSTLIS